MFGKNKSKLLVNDVHLRLKDYYYAVKFLQAKNVKITTLNVCINICDKDQDQEKKIDEIVSIYNNTTKMYKYLPTDIAEDALHVISNSYITGDIIKYKDKIECDNGRMCYSMVSYGSGGNNIIDIQIMQSETEDDSIDDDNYDERFHHINLKFKLTQKQTLAIIKISNKINNYSNPKVIAVINSIKNKLINNRQKHSCTFLQTPGNTL